MSFGTSRQKTSSDHFATTDVERRQEIDRVETRKKGHYGWEVLLLFPSSNDFSLARGGEREENETVLVRTPFRREQTIL